MDQILQKENNINNSNKQSTLDTNKNSILFYNNGNYFSFGKDNSLTNNNLSIGQNLKIRINNIEIEDYIELTNLDIENNNYFRYTSRITRYSR